MPGKKIELQITDKRTICNSRQKWIPSKTRGTKHRKKRAVGSNYDILPNFDSDTAEENVVTEQRKRARDLLHGSVYRGGQGDGPGLDPESGDGPDIAPESGEGPELDPEPSHS